MDYAVFYVFRSGKSYFSAVSRCTGSSMTVHGVAAVTRAAYKF